MSLRIDLDSVVAVLLGDGKWYLCDRIEFGRYELADNGPEQASGSETWFRMVTDESDPLGTKVIYGPVGSIVAVEEAFD